MSLFIPNPSRKQEFTLQAPLSDREIAHHEPMGKRNGKMA